MQSRTKEQTQSSSAVMQELPELGCERAILSKQALTQPDACQGGRRIRYVSPRRRERRPSPHLGHHAESAGETVQMRRPPPRRRL